MCINIRKKNHIQVKDYKIKGYLSHNFGVDSYNILVS